MKNKLLVLLLLFAAANSSFAQPGANDPTFNTFGNGAFGDGTGFNAEVFATILQPDGKIIACGSFTQYNGELINRIIRIHPDGSIDSSFDPGTGFDVNVMVMAAQTGGKILVGGLFTTFNGASKPYLVRLNSDGSLDNTFNVSGTGPNGFIRAILIQPDGKILIGGGFGYYNGVNMNSIIRLNSDGTLDPTFNPGTGFSGGDVRSFALQPDGKIVVGGAFTSFNGTPANRIIRLNPSGSLDNTFNAGTGFDNEVYEVCLQPDGKVLVGGRFDEINATTIHKLTRLNADGSYDGSFITGEGFGSLFSDCVEQITVLPNDQIMVCGEFDEYDVVVARGIVLLNPDGTRDMALNSTTGLMGAINSFEINPDGKILVAGNFTSYQGFGTPVKLISRLNTDATLDITFNPVTGFSHDVYVMTVQPDSKTIVGGNFTVYDTVPRNRIARLNAADGALDLTFDPGSGFDNIVTALVVQSDGKILVGGWFNLFNGIPVSKVVRLNTDGSLDLSFTTGIGFNNNFVECIALQPDGKILVGGDFTTYDGNSCGNLVRLNADGSFDNSLITGTGFNNFVSEIAVQPDNKILVGGGYTMYDGTSQNDIIRLNPDGSKDLTFGIGTGFDPYSDINGIVILPDGKIIVAGDFYSYNGTIARCLVKLHADGNMDTSFDQGTGFYGMTVNAINVQSDGKIIAVGIFNSFDGITRGSILRLDADGSLDADFAPSGIGTTSQILNSALQSDGKILVGGQFVKFNDEPKFRINRLLPGCSLGNTFSTINPSACDSYTENGQTYTTSGTYTQVIPNTSGCDSMITLNITVDNINTTIDQLYTTLTSAETVGSFQWLDCDNSYAPLIGATINTYSPTSTGNFAIEIIKGACHDTTNCLPITNQDFYDDPAYQSMIGEVFTLPVSNIDSCDAPAIASLTGGIAPYSYDWFTQAFNENTSTIDSLCEGIHALKITDNLGDSILIDYYITDAINYDVWYDSTLIATDTIYIAASNCLLNYSLPLDSAVISDLYYLAPDTISPGDLYFIELTYYQSGTAYTHHDTIVLETAGLAVIDFSLYCPTKSISNVKVVLFGLNYPTTLGVNNVDQKSILQIYPNPTTGNFIVAGLPETGTIEILTLQGQPIFRNTISTAQMHIDLSEFANGIYLVKISGETGIVTTTLIKN